MTNICISSAANNNDNNNQGKVDRAVITLPTARVAPEKDTLDEEENAQRYDDALDKDNVPDEEQSLWCKYSWTIMLFVALTLIALIFYALIAATHDVDKDNSVRNH